MGDVSDPMSLGSLPVAPPVPLPAQKPWWSARRFGWFLGGAAAGVVGQVLICGYWLHSFASFVSDAVPDTMFMVTGIAALAQLVLFVGCIGAGIGALRRNRSLGVGLIAGWPGGLVAVALGLVLLFSFA
ncbi:hypothetical protein [Dactylosporangium matsuzakiense]|uniref:Uncharacterized protein n=1 Tax=Dactylosporangium matsuzakiense TaxID=53360 RepID=A0A9W6KJH3_9ACTN|nr:hypothetical protein [Dactylosporangium matsuzakiense]UWZ48175.1 hypothetical protein Dmats_18280 [Dactylosporangium matsuzakiense]GLL03196.1 hypothetical protein GCM10017581_049390 [Dactylosporangium matsuzakiense]